MPLARIITLYPEHAGDIAQQLKLQGFSVELAGPDEIHLPPADLEIDLEICNPAQALERASHLAGELGADVMVASGALDWVAEPAAVAHVELQPAAMAEIQAGPQAPPMQTIIAQSTEAQSTEEDLSHELPSHNPHFAPNLGMQLRESLSELSLAAADLRKRLVELLRTAAGSTRSRMAMARANLASVAESLTARAHEYQERMKQKAAEYQEGREGRRLEVVSHQSEAQQQNASLQAAGQKQEPEQGEQREDAAAAAASQQALPARPVRKQLRRSTSESAQRTPLQLRGIFTGALAASALFVAGMVLANVHPQSPLPASITQRPGEQHVPFGAVIVQGAPAQPKVNVVQPQSVPAQAAMKPPAIEKRKPHPYRANNRRARQRADDITADDVVVRHFPGPMSRPVQPAQQAKLKRYSDLDK